jgi:hypothetical protein
VHDAILSGGCDIVAAVASARAVVCAAALVVAVSASASALGACGGGNAVGTEPDGTTGGRFGQVYDQLCVSRELAANGDPATARRTFDDIHTGIHDLAAKVEATDRPTAAVLLRAKQRVEAEGQQPTAADVGALVDAVRAGIRALGGAVPDTCP